MVYGGAGDDSIVTWDNSDNNTLSGGAGDDTFEVWGGNDLILYNKGDGNDLIKAFGEDDTLSIGGGSYSTTKSSADIIVTVDKNKITLEGAAILSKLNIVGKKAASTLLAVTNKTKSPVTVGSSFKIIDASARTKAIKITGNKLANSIAGGSKNDSLYGGNGDDTILGNAGNDKLYGQAGNDYLLGDNFIKLTRSYVSINAGAGNDVFFWGGGNDLITDYDEGDKIKISSGTVTTVKTGGNNVVFTVGKNKITVTGGKGKSIFYSDKGGEHIYSGSKTNVSISGATIKLLPTYLSESFNIANYGATLQNIDASKVLLDMKITGNKLRNSILGGANNETLIGGKGNDTLTGGDGSNVFIYSSGDGNDVITDYSEEDTIKITKGTAKVAKKNKDVIFTVGNGKITLKSAADKVVTYIDAKGKTNYYPAPTKDSIIINGTAVTVLEEYKSATFDVGNVKNGSKVKRIDASPVSHDLEIVGNAQANVILGGAGDDTIYGGKSNDTLQGGDSADIFVYDKGDGNDLILDYAEEDTIKITSGTIKSKKTSGSDVIFTIGSGKITILGAANKTVSYIEGGKKKTYGGSASNVLEDDNFITSNNLSAIVEDKAIDYSFAEVETPLIAAKSLIKLAHSIKK